MVEVLRVKHRVISHKARMWTRAVSIGERREVSETAARAVLLEFIWGFNFGEERERGDCTREGTAWTGAGGHVRLDFCRGCSSECVCVLVCVIGKQ